MNYTTQDQPFGHTLAELGAMDKNIIVIDADLQRATETNYFQEKFPERYFDVGIAEANMVGISAGFGLSGKTVFCGTFSSFITQRVCDQVVVSVAYCRSNVKLMGVEPGIASGRNGASHQALLDIAIMRAIPGMTVFDPADVVELKAMMRHLASTPGPAYMRVPRGKVPVIFDEEKFQFKIGKANLVSEGRDATIITGGILLIEAIEAADLLAQKGVHVRVLNMGSLKPIDEEAILKAARETGCVITAENHSASGGLGSAVAEILCQNYPVPMKILGIHDRFGEVGPNDWLLEHFGLDAAHIAQAVIETLDKKGKTNE
jgi:transketolase